MSQDSTFNPYSSSPVAADKYVGKIPLHGYAKVACIFFIILGSLGILGTVAAIVQSLIQIAASANAEDGQANPFVQAFPGALALSIVFGVVSALVSVAEIVGGVFGLQQKRLGATLIKGISAFMVFFKIAETGVAVAQVSLGFDQVKEEALKKAASNKDVSQQDMSAILDIGMYVGLGFIVAIGLFMLFFYLFTFLHFSKQSTQQQFS